MLGRIVKCERLIKVGEGFLSVLSRKELVLFDVCWLELGSPTARHNAIAPRKASSVSLASGNLLLGREAADALPAYGAINRCIKTRPAASWCGLASKRITEGITNAVDQYKASYHV
jgi:hypothetical protein